MVSHILALGLIQAIRCLLGVGLGGFLLYRSFVIPFERLPRLEPGDQTLFLAAGIGFVLLGAVRGLQGGMTLAFVAASRRGRPPTAERGRLARKLGLWLAVIDLVDLVEFPLSTACGVYGLLVYRHPDALDFFEGRFSTGAVQAAVPARA